MSNLSPMGLTRDNKSVLWTTALVALVTYLLASAPPTQWGYHDWLKFASAVLAYISAKGQSSPLAHSEGK